MLNEQQAKELVQKIIAFSTADEVNVTVSGNRIGNIRYARNTVSTNGETESTQYSITSVFGKRSGTATGNEFDEATLKRILERSEEIARLAPENPEYLPALGAQEYGRSVNYAQATADIDPAFRADAALASIEACIKSNTTAAGYLEDQSGFIAIGNNRGLFAYDRSSSGEFTVTARTADEKGSGYGVQYFTDARNIDTKQATETAIRKAKASVETKELKPGKYTVILEPQAAYDLVSLLVGSFDARSADEGRSFFGKRGSGNRMGEKLFDEKVTIVSDPFDPLNPSTPFAPDGRPRNKTTWVEQGVLKQLAYSRYWAQQKNVSPIPPPSGFSMAGSNKSLEDLISSTEKGILVTRFYYIRPVDAQTLVQTGLTRDGTFYIENGKVQYAIKNMRFNESPAFMLNNLRDVGQAVRINRSLVPSMKIDDFNFTSLSDAV